MRTNPIRQALLLLFSTMPLVLLGKDAAGGDPGRPVSVQIDGATHETTMIVVSESFLKPIKANPALGRDFLPEDFAPSAKRAAIISQQLWESAFGRQPGAIGRELRVDGRDVTIVAIAPAKPAVLSGSKIWIAAAGGTSGGAAFAQCFDRLGIELARLGEGATEAEKLKCFERAVQRLNELNARDPRLIETGEAEELCALANHFAVAAGLDPRKYAGGEGPASLWREW